MPVPFTVKRVGLTVELLIFDAYGPRVSAPDVMSRMLAKTLAANRGVAALGAELPRGTVVTIPDLDAAAPAPARTAVSIFGD